MEIREVSALAAKIKNNIEKVMVGKSDEIEGSLLVGAAPLETFKEVIDEIPSSIVVTGSRPEHLQYVIEKQVPAVIITSGGDEAGIDFSNYQ